MIVSLVPSTIKVSVSYCLNLTNDLFKDTTLTVTVVVTPLVAVIVIVAVPVPTALTTPELDTLPTRVLSDAIMIARGDMGVEIPMEEVPIIQKMIIKKVYAAGKQVITATQMLDSMMKNPRPTRAEVTDVANAIYDGTSAIMLSGETAAGAYPVEALQAMARIAERAEADIDYRKRFFSITRDENPDITDAICHATCTTALDLGARAILTVTKSGCAARMISRYRPQSAIIACTPSA